MVEPSKVMSPYSGFLVDKLNKIYDSWDAGDPEWALRRACRLVIFLPRSLKKELKGEVELISKEMNWAYSLKTVDFFTTHLVRNRHGRRIATARLPPFLDKMLDLLDQKGFLFELKRKIPEGGD